MPKYRVDPCWLLAILLVSEGVNALQTVSA
jgi:hypothetical protein